MRQYAVIAFLILATGLSGCSYLVRERDPDPEEARQEEQPADINNVPINIFQSRVGFCPAASVLGDAEFLTKFSGGGRDITNVAFEAEFLGVETNCRFGREFTRRFAYSSVRIDIEAVLGSTAVPQSSRIPYFIAVVNPDTQQVILREVYELEADFSRNRRTVRLTDQIDQIKIPVIENEDALQYEFIVGFDLTPEEVEFNRNRED